jgi:hypothetical protein
MAFKRIIELDVGQNNNTGIRISALNITFETERSVDFESNFGKFQIFNAKKETRDKMLIRGNNIVLRCGYEDENNLAIVFFGFIVESNSKKEGTEWITEIVARDFGSNRNNIDIIKVSLSYNAKTILSTVVSDIANIMEVPVIGTENISNIFLNNGFVFVGSVRNALRKVNKIAGINRIGIYFDQSEMVIYRKGTADTRFGVVSISPRSGLIGEVEEDNDDIEEKDVSQQQQVRKKIIFSSLLNPKLKPNSVVNIVSSKVTGAFIVEKVRHQGDNFGGDFISQVEAIE